ncbi:unnamed protein product, partial [Staurois parvus]
TLAFFFFLSSKNTRNNVLYQQHIKLNNSNGLCLYNYFFVYWAFVVDMFTIRGRGGLTIWKLGHCPRARGQ